MDTRLESLPPAVRAAIQSLREADATSTQQLVDYFLDEISRLTSRFGGEQNTLNRNAVTLSNFRVQFETKLSQIVPVRKQVEVRVGEDGLATFSGGSSSTTPLESGSWNDFNVMLLLPLPKKAKKQENLVLTKLGTALTSLVFGVNSSSAEIEELLRILKTHCKYSDTTANEDSVVVAYVGAREGLLYLLDDFVFYGFRKPLKLFILAEIDSISFTLVTSRTFNVVVQLLDGSVHEFEQISHSFFNMFQNYIARHNLSDQSMAEERRAKRRKTAPSELEQAEELAETARLDNSDDDENDKDVQTESEDESEERGD